jgi:hypothetical protein
MKTLWKRFRWQTWFSDVGAALVQARIEGRWKEKGVSA